MQNRTEVKEILNYISEDQLDFFAKETMVDWNVKKLKGYKIPKISFCNELQNEIIKQVVIHCGGDPDKLQTFNT